jgi:hypothetical protein
MPKSVTFTAPPAGSRMLPGFTSRWITPAVCAACSAPAVSATIESARAAGSRPSRASRLDSGSPSTSSITRYDVPPSSP